MYYVKAKKILSFSGEKEERYVARLFRSEYTTLDTIAKEISHATSVSYPDVLAALKAFEIHVSNHVLMGSAVKFGTLGAFIPSIHSKSVKKPEDVDAECVRRITCRFYPSVAFKQTMKSAVLEYKDLSKVKHA